PPGDGGAAAVGTDGAGPRSHRRGPFITAPRANAALLLVVVGVDLNVLSPLLWDVAILADGADRANGLAGAAFDADVRIDVELAMLREIRIRLMRMDAVDRAGLHTRLVLHVDTRLTNHVGHGALPFLSIDPEFGLSAKFLQCKSTLTPMRQSSARRIAPPRKVRRSPHPMGWGRLPAERGLAGFGDGTVSAAAVDISGSRPRSLPGGVRMLTHEENELLTRVGPAQPAGELLRRYWHPVAYLHELTDDHPTVFVRILGENLVLFRDKSGNVGLLGDQCPHRGASLLYGRVEERGIACAYHGWLFDTKGNCLETPAEPSESLFRLTVKHTAYPVQSFIGMYWAYLGPLPAPVIPRYDVWVRKDGRRRLYLQPQLDCNWLQPMENSVDPSHLQILHQALISGGRKIENTTRGLTDDVRNFEFYETPFGIMKKRTYQNGLVDEHPLIFPNILRQGNATQIRVPIDDTHTKIFFVRFDPTEDGSIIEDEGTPPVE